MQESLTIQDSGLIAQNVQEQLRKLFPRSAYKRNCFAQAVETAIENGSIVDIYENMVVPPDVLSGKKTSEDIFVLGLFAALSQDAYIQEDLIREKPLQKAWEVTRYTNFLRKNEAVRFVLSGDKQDPFLHIQHVLFADETRNQEKVLSDMTFAYKSGLAWQGNLEAVSLQEDTSSSLLKNQRFSIVFLGIPATHKRIYRPKK